MRSAIGDVMGFIQAEAANIPWQGSIIKADARRAFINRGASANIKRGDELAVFAKGESLIDPDTGFNLGTDEEYLCQIHINAVKEKFSTATLGAACRQRVINRGDIVRYE